jgi:predicted ATP-grasp superfamily ATP-dependent carboligase
LRLLITNTAEEQPYLLIQCLRHQAERMVVTVPEGSMFKRWSVSPAWSRFVHKRYTAPACNRDWKAGRISEENSPAEEQYIQRLEYICRLEELDIIYPSYDSDVYVLAKNQQRLMAQGILAVVPEYQALLKVLDKSLTLQAAARVGFPVPASATPANMEELHQAARAFGPPWVLKSRLAAHGGNLAAAGNLQELEQAFTRLSALQERPVMQEYIAPLTKRNVYLVINREMEIVSLFSPVVHRCRNTGLGLPCAAVESSHEQPLRDQVQALVSELGIWGGLTLQTLVDQRDGALRLMEINPRFGHNLWYRTELGINEPLMNLRIAQGLDPGPMPGFEAGVLLLDPLMDAMHLAGQAPDQGLARLRGRLPAPAERAPYEAYEPLGDLLRAYRLDYFSRRPRITTPLSRGWLTDPGPPLMRNLRSVAKSFGRRSA